MILFPEMSICGYPARDWVEKRAFVEKCQEAAEHVAANTRGIAVICGGVTPTHANVGKRVMNSALFLRDGKIEFVQSNMLLPTYDVFDEMRNFASDLAQSLFQYDGDYMARTVCEEAS